MATPATPIPGPVPSPPARRTPGIRIPPPLIYAGAVAGGLMLDAALGTPFTPGGHADAPRAALGVLIAIAGIALAVWAKRRFARAGTSALPWRPSAALVPTGPYRFTRNPMYLGMAAATFGLAIALGSFWSLILLAPAVVLVDRHAIRREERYLEDRFGEEYRAYRARVRRWV